MAFNNPEFARLDKKWSRFRDDIREYRDGSAYSALWVETWPLLYKTWQENDRVVDKDVARLLSTLGNLFQCFDDGDGNTIGPQYAEVANAFHCCFLDSLLFHDDLSFTEDGKLIVPGWDDEDWVIDPTTFELPDEIPE